MAIKELIKAEVDNLDEEHLDELYDVIKRFVEWKHTHKESIMDQLRHIKIDAPEDFSANFELYTSGEKHVE